MISSRTVTAILRAGHCRDLPVGSPGGRQRAIGTLPGSRITSPPRFYGLLVRGFPERALRRLLINMKAGSDLE